MKNWVFFLAICVSSPSVVLTMADATCSLLNVGTNPASPSGFNDIVREGHVQPRWIANSTNPILVQSSKTLEFFYIEDLRFGLGQDNLHLTSSDSQFVRTSLEMRRENGTFFTIQIKYECPPCTLR
eukprot:TRINITY_DN13954_c0_g1_i1.p1 TRINITY_DN13954_c0_g1~~TRINITY_DN13954_c0_g1_i1.p1  ORF type:complete len:126 (+),score=2.63 TRINITY_DN13954_c0_g1_i1:188-565(+)